MVQGSQHQGARGWAKCIIIMMLRKSTRMMQNQTHTKTVRNYGSGWDGGISGLDIFALIQVRNKLLSRI